MLLLIMLYVLNHYPHVIRGTDLINSPVMSSTISVYVLLATSNRPARMSYHGQYLLY